MTTMLKQYAYITFLRWFI